MKNKIRWFDNEDVVGYIENKRNGDVIVCCSRKDYPNEHIRLNLIRNGDLLELRKED